MSQHGAQEVVEPPNDGVSNSVPDQQGGQCSCQEITFHSTLWSLRKC